MAKPSDQASTQGASDTSSEVEFPGAVVVLPSGKEGGYADIALTGLFGTHMANLNVGKQLIWQRYYVLLAADAALLALAGHPTSMREAVGFLCFGLALCAIWLLMSIIGWSHNIRDVQEASRFTWLVFNKPTGNRIDPNPHARARTNYMSTWHEGGWIHDKIFMLALCLIIASGLAHVLVFLHSCSILAG